MMCDEVSHCSSLIWCLVFQKSFHLSFLFFCSSWTLRFTAITTPIIQQKKQDQKKFKISFHHF
jgi:hypothetical protein